MIDKTEEPGAEGTEVEKPQLAEINIDSIIQQLLSVRDAPGRQVQILLTYFSYDNNMIEK